MPTFDRMIMFDAPPDAVRLAISFALYPALIVVRPEQSRAIARVGDFLHLFQWLPAGDQTSLRYRIRHDLPGTLDQLAGDPAVYEAASADLTESENLEAEAVVNRLSAAVAEINPNAVRPGMPLPAPLGLVALFLWTLFLGPAGFFVAAVNWRRLDRPERFWPTALLGSAAYCALALLLRVALLSWIDQPLISSLGVIPYAAGVGALLVAWQRPAYKRWIETYGVPTRAEQQVGCGFVAALLGATVAALLIVGIVWLLTVGNSLESAVHKQVTVSGIHLTYPGLWSRVSDARAHDLNCPAAGLTECVVVLERQNSSGAIIIQRQHQQISPESLVFLNVGTVAMLRLSLGADNVTLGKATPLKIGNRPALQQVAEIRSSHTSIEVLYIQESSYSYVLLMAVAGQDSGVSHEINDIVNSLEFGAQ